jgi:hypothetical protein
MPLIAIFHEAISGNFDVFFSIFRKSVIIIIYAHKAFPLLYFYKI